MWKDYSRDYLKHNRAASFSVIAASLAASLFLSLLLHLAFQFWNYEINLITEEEGGWTPELQEQKKMISLFCVPSLM